MSAWYFEAKIHHTVVQKKSTNIIKFTCVYCRNMIKLHKVTFDVTQNGHNTLMKVLWVYTLMSMYIRELLKCFFFVLVCSYI